jgi:hypothetical protein
MTMHRALANKRTDAGSDELGSGRVAYVRKALRDGRGIVSDERNLELDTRPLLRWGPLGLEAGAVVEVRRLSVLCSCGVGNTPDCGLLIGLEGFGAESCELEGRAVRGIGEFRDGRCSAGVERHPPIVVYSSQKSDRDRARVGVHDRIVINSDAREGGSSIYVDGYRWSTIGRDIFPVKVSKICDQLTRNYLRKFLRDHTTRG